MALTISQIVSVSYPAVVAEMKKPANQWAENALLRELERMGAIKRKSLGPTIELPIDYQRNQGADFLATDMTPTSLTKTEVLNTASFSVAELTVPVTWSKGDEAKNPSENQKVAFVKALLANALETHDDMIEDALLATSSTDGFNNIGTLVPDSGQGTVGGINAATETFWRNHAAEYLADGSDIEAQMTEAWNTAAKGSGSALAPKLLVSGAEAQALFESTQQALQRYVDGDDLKAGFKTLAFKTARYIFSQHGDDHVFFLNPKSFMLVVSSQFFRDKGETKELENANAYNFKIYSALQSVTNNKSRLAVIDQAD